VLSVQSSLQAFRTLLKKPVDGSSLAAFRFFFGIIALWDVVKYFQHQYIEKYFVNVPLHFKYYFFEFVKPWPGDWIYLHFSLLGLAALAIAFGYFYRWATVIFFILYANFFFIDSAMFNNHYYLLLLISFLMIFLDSNRCSSADKYKFFAGQNALIPFWQVFILRAQIFIVYFFGGIAKLNGDWLRGEPLRTWLAQRTYFPIIGKFFTEEWVVYVFTYGALLFDLFIGFLLCWRRTRVIAIIGVLFFNLMNGKLFNIGIFPSFMIAAALLFLDPDKFGRWWKRLNGTFRQKNEIKEITQNSRYFINSPKVATALLVVFFIYNIFMPLRHWMIPGDVRWTSEGSYFAWRMKLNHKNVTASFYIPDYEQEKMFVFNPNEHLPNSQLSFVTRSPYLILQYVRFLEQNARKMGIEEPQVYALIHLSVNARPLRPFSNSKIDLTKEKYSPLTHSQWIYPFDPKY